MKKNTMIKILPLLALPAFILGACSNGASTPEPTEQSEAIGEQVVAPVMATPEDLDGKTVEITTMSPLVVTVDDTAGWTGSVEDGKIAEFVPGGPEGDADFNPGFTALSVGETAATLTSPAGKTTEFTISVTE